MKEAAATRSQKASQKSDIAGMDSIGFEEASLADYLLYLRTSRSLTQRAVEEATEKRVSNAYLSQLESGKATKPSPDILYCLAEVYGASYDKLMKKAGYIRPSSARAQGVKHGSAATFAIENLSADEERELLKYLAFVRSQKSKAGSR